MNHPVIALFELTEFRGDMVCTSGNISNLKPYFPPSKKAGVSSVIAITAIYNLYSRPGYNDAHHEINAKNTTLQVHNLAARGFDDKVQSLKLLRH